MPSASLDRWMGGQQSLTRGLGINAPLRSSAVRPFTATGLTNSIAALNEAIEAALVEEGGSGEDRYHPSDPDLPVASVSANRFGGTTATGRVQYRRVSSAVDLKIPAKTQASRIGSSWSFTWWRDTTEFDSEDRPNGPFRFHPHSDSVPESHRRPLSWTFRIGVTAIIMPTIISSRPSITTSALAYQINSNIDAQWLDVGAFPAKSLLMLPYRDTRMEDGRYFVQYKALYNPRKWQFYSQPVWNTTDELWEDAVVDAFPSVTFPTLSVHTP